MTKELLGYIRFKYDKNGDGYGHVEITNFGASLEYNHLKIGATTKGDQTGQHGIGLKVAALAFLRSPNHQSFRIECSLGRWVFIINSEFELCCKTEHITPEYIEQAEKMKDSSTLGSNPSTDVSVYIGHLGRGIHVDAFRKWLDVVRDTYSKLTLDNTAAGKC